MKVKLLLLFFVLTNSLFAQTAPASGTEENKTSPVTSDSTQIPSFPGGDEQFKQFLVDNIKYPPKARRRGIHGVIYVTFIVEKDGSISQVTAQNDIGGGCKEEAIRVVGMMPKWNPGYYEGELVRVRMTLPIRFRFQ